MINNQSWQLIGEAVKDDKVISVYRNISGKWHVKCDNITTQHSLNATEIVRYLCNAANRY